MLKNLQNKKETQGTDKKVFLFWKREGEGWCHTLNIWGLSAKILLLCFFIPYEAFPTSTVSIKYYQVVKIAAPIQFA